MYYSFNFREPFSIGQEDDAILLARYLIEDNNEENIIFDIHRSCEDRIILDIIKKLIGKYDLFENPAD